MKYIDLTPRVKKEAILSWPKRIIYSILLIATVYSLLRFLLWWFLPGHIPQNWPASPLHILDNLIFVFLSFVVFAGYLSTLGVWLSVWFMSKPKYIPPQKGLKIAFLTCFVPGKEPISILKNTLKAMKKVRYPHDTWVLDEGNSDEIKKLCRELGVNHFSRKGSRRFNVGIYRRKTKAGNHNAWRFHFANKYDLVAQVDMDHKPDPSFLEKTIGYFKDPDVAIVGLPEIYKNTKNWISRGASEQSSIFHHVMQTGYFGSNMPFLIGAGHIYRVSAMEKIGGYAPTIVEDHLTGMRLYANGYKGVFTPEILAKGQGPLNWSDYFGQQFRWSYGLFEILFLHTPGLILKLNWKQKINYLLAQTYYFTGVGVFIGAILSLLYLWFGIEPTRMRLLEWLFNIIPLFIMEQILYLYILSLSVNKKWTPIYGIKGKILNFGANIVYATAFITLIFRKRLSYTVTAKRMKKEPSVVPLKIFTLHVILLTLSLAGLFMSVIFNHPSLIQRLWGGFTVLTMGIVIGSNYLPSLNIVWKKTKLVMQTQIDLLPQLSHRIIRL